MPSLMDMYLSDPTFRTEEDFEELLEALQLPENRELKELILNVDANKEPKNLTIDDAESLGRIWNEKLSREDKLYINEHVDYYGAMDTDETGRVIVRRRGGKDRKRKSVKRARKSSRKVKRRGTKRR